LTALDPLRKSVLLAPNSKTEVTWLLQQTGPLTTGYLYTYPLELHAQGAVYRAEFQASLSGVRYARQDIESLLAPSGTQDNPSDFFCTAAPVMFVGMDLIVTCNAPDRDLVCYEKQCNTPKRNQTNFTLPMAEPGVHTYAFVLRSLRTQAESYVTVDVQVEPDVVIEDAKVPALLKYDEDGELNFLVSPASNSRPLKLNVTVSHPAFTQSWTQDALDHPMRYKLYFSGESLDLGANTLTITAAFKDEFGKHYTQTKTVEVKMETDLFYQKLLIWNRKAWQKISSLGPVKTIASWFE
jgi:hypothetical protein